MKITKRSWILFVSALLLIGVIAAVLVVRHYQKINSVTDMLERYLAQSFCDRRLFDHTAMDRDELNDVVHHLAVYHGISYPLQEDHRITKSELEENVRELGHFLLLITDYYDIPAEYDEENKCYIVPPHEEDVTYTHIIHSVKQTGETSYAAQVSFVNAETQTVEGTDTFHFEVYRGAIHYLSVTKNT